MEASSGLVWILRLLSLLNILNISLSGGFLSGRLILLDAWIPNKVLYYLMRGTPPHVFSHLS